MALNQVGRVLTRIATDYHDLAICGYAGWLFASQGDQLGGQEHWVVPLALAYGVLVAPVLKYYTPRVLNKLFPDKFKFNSYPSEAEMTTTSVRNFIAAFLISRRQTSSHQVLLDVLIGGGILNLDINRILTRKDRPTKNSLRTIIDEAREERKKMLEDMFKKD